MGIPQGKYPGMGCFIELLFKQRKWYPPKCLFLFLTSPYKAQTLKIPGNINLRLPLLYKKASNFHKIGVTFELVLLHRITMSTYHTIVVTVTNRQKLPFHLKEVNIMDESTYFSIN